MGLSFLLRVAFPGRSLRHLRHHRPLRTQGPVDPREHGERSYVRSVQERCQEPLVLSSIGFWGRFSGFAAQIPSPVGPARYSWQEKKDGAVREWAWANVVQVPKVEEVAGIHPLPSSINHDIESIS